MTEQCFNKASLCIYRRLTNILSILIEQREEKKTDCKEMEIDE